MMTLLDFWNDQDKIDRCGMDIRFILPRTSLIDFRISYGNQYSISNEDDISIFSHDVETFASEIERQLSDAGYYVKECNGVFLSNCFYTFLKQNDEQIKYPRMRVYIHPAEMAGWAPKKEIQKLLIIAKENSFTKNEELVYSQKVYNLSEDQYKSILQAAEPQIIEWLIAYRNLYKRKWTNAPARFDRIFGVKRLQCRHLSYHDHVAQRFVSDLMIDL